MIKGTYPRVRTLGLADLGQTRLVGIAHDRGSRLQAGFSQFLLRFETGNEGIEGRPELVAVDIAFHHDLMGGAGYLHISGRPGACNEVLDDRC